MPRPKKKEMTLAVFTEKSLQRPIATIIKELYNSYEQISELKKELRKAKPRKTDDIAALKAEVKRLRKVESKYLKILEFAKSESSEDQN